MTNFSQLNPENFRKWMKNHSDFDSKIEQKSVLGRRAETRFSPARIAKHATVEEGKTHKVLGEFVEDGGVIKEVNDNEYLIEVKSGSFIIDRRYVIV